MDIIFCRNVAIYFNEQDKIRLFRNLGRTLARDGALIIGATESLTGLCPEFEPKRYLRAVYYQLKADPGEWRMPLEWFIAQLDYILFGGVLSALLLATRKWWRPAGVRRFWPWALPAAFAAVFALGWVLAEWQGRSVEADLRRDILHQATVIAATIDPDLVKQLSFTAADKSQPAFRSIREHLIAYGRYAGLGRIYTLAVRGRAIVCGPESLDERESPASEPGQVDAKLHPLFRSAFQTASPGVVGPFTDEQGAFVTGFAPVVESRSGEVLMLVGVDMPAEPWGRRVCAARLLPIPASLVMVLILAGGSAVLNRRARAAPGQAGWERYAERA